MCLAVPAQIIRKKDNLAVVQVDGIQREISLMLLPESEVGDYILMHAGFAIQKVEKEEAEIRLQYVKEVFSLAD